MKYMLLAAIALAFGFALAGCETMSAEECAAADWRGLGFSDAASSGASRFSDRAESCADKGYMADGQSYSAGFADGMVQFCQPPNAFNFARRGGTFSGSCPAELQYDFYAAFEDGRRVHDAETELSAARSDISNIESRRDQIDRDIRDRENALSQAANDEERNRLRDEIDGMRRERRDLGDNLRSAQQRVYYAQRRIDDLHREIGARWSAW